MPYSLIEMYSLPIQEPISLIDFSGTLAPAATKITDGGGIPCVGHVLVYGMTFCSGANCSLSVQQGTFDVAGTLTFDLVSTVTVTAGANATTTNINVAGKFIRVVITNTGVVDATVRSSIWLRPYT